MLTLFRGFTAGWMVPPGIADLVPTPGAISVHPTCCYLIDQIYPNWCEQGPKLCACMYCVAWQSYLHAYMCRVLLTDSANDANGIKLFRAGGGQHPNCVEPEVCASQKPTSSETRVPRVYFTTTPRSKAHSTQPRLSILTIWQHCFEGGSVHER